MVRETSLMSSLQMLEDLFGTIYREIDFVRRSHTSLYSLGINDDNAIAIVACCRDELSQTLRSIVKHVWGEAFNLSSLAGMITAGRTGLKAAMHHAPHVDNRERYVFYAIPHIAIGTECTLGVCSRKGIDSSSACGALSLFQSELQSGKLNISLDEWDIEESLLKRRLLREIPYGHVPDLLELTKIARKVMQADLEHVIAQVVDPDRSDYAVITGIQIHAPEDNYIWPAESYAFVDKTVHKLVI